MNEMYKRIQDLCGGKGITVGRMCSIVGVSRGMLTDLKMNRTAALSSKNTAKIAEYFGVSTDYLISGKVKDDYEEIMENWIPVLGRVAAGIPVEAIEYVEDYEELSPDMAAKGDYFALKVKGDSMEPKFSDGDVLIVKRQPDCENNDIAVVLVNGEDATVKRIKKTPAGLMLIPNNPAYEPTFYSNSEIKDLPVTILGKVVELRAKF